MGFEVKDPPKGTDDAADEKPKDTKPKDAAKGKAKVDSKPKKTAKGPAKRGPKDLEAKLNEFLNVAAAGVFPFAPNDGIVLAARGPALTHAWAELAKVNPDVRRVLERLVTGGVWSGVIASSLAVAIPIAQNHIPAARAIPMFGMSEAEIDVARANNETIDTMMKLQDEMQKMAGANGETASG